MLEFKIPQLTDKIWVDSLLKISDYIGDSYCFGNIYNWKSEYLTEILRFGDALLIKTGAHGNAFTYPAGSFEIKEIFKELFAYAESIGERFYMNGVTKNQAAYIDDVFPGKFHIQEDRDYFDYIYSSEDLINLRGRKYHGKRNHISQFKRLYDWQYETINSSNIEQCREMAVRWFALEGAEEDFDGEKKALNAALDAYDTLDFSGGLIKVQGEVIAFTLGERLNTNTFCSHFEKAFSRYQGAYPMINREFAAHELSGYQYINREEDMGIVGLRKSKLSYQPAILLEKYSVFLK